MDLVLRMLIAGLFGAAIGIEREYRAKEAGIRTHFIVALGSALFMIISQFAFEDQHDASRVAAQVVSGIGFIGAGVIIFQKNVVRGVTTAAGLWVTAAIGLAAGGGLYLEAGAAALMSIIVLEIMHFIHMKIGGHQLTAVFSAADPAILAALPEALKAKGIEVEKSVLVNHGTSYHITMDLRTLDSKYLPLLTALAGTMPGITLESVE